MQKLKKKYVGKSFKEEDGNVGFFLRAGIAYQSYHDYKDMKMPPDIPKKDDYCSYRCSDESIGVSFNSVEAAMDALELIDFEQMLRYRGSIDRMSVIVNAMPTFSITKNRNDTWHREYVSRSEIFDLIDKAKEEAEGKEIKRRKARELLMRPLHNEYTVLATSDKSTLLMRLSFSEGRHGRHGQNPTIHNTFQWIRNDNLKEMIKETSWRNTRGIYWSDYEIGYEGKVAFKRFWDDHKYIRDSLFPDEDFLSEYDRGRAGGYQAIEQRKNFYLKMRALLKVGNEWSARIQKEAGIK